MAEKRRRQPDPPPRLGEINPPWEPAAEAGPRVGEVNPIPASPTGKVELPAAQRTPSPLRLRRPTPPRRKGTPPAGGEKRKAA